MLRQRGNIGEIRKMFRSASQVAEGVRIFLNEADGQVSEKQSALQALDEELSAKHIELEECKATVETLSNKTGVLRTEKQQLVLDINRLGERKSRLQNEITDLQERGYTPDLLSKIRSLEPRGGPQLWSDLKLASHRHELKAETQRLRQEKTTLIDEVKELRTKKEEETKLARSEENRVDDLRLQAEAVRVAVSTVELFFKDGWSAEDLQCLKLGLDALGIAREPRASIGRLLRAVGDEKSLASLSEKVDRKREELTMLNDACAKTKADSQALQTVTVKIIEEARDESVKAIATVAEHGKTETEASASSLEKLSLEASAQISAQVQQIIGDLKAELGNWGGTPAREGKT
jgi:chromosome segregation ATPase